LWNTEPGFCVQCVCVSGFFWFGVICGQLCSYDSAGDDMREQSTIRQPRSFVASRESTAGRVVAAFVCLGCLMVLGLAAWLEPSGGHGTHMQLGFPRCAWITQLGFPCPTCGMTTAFAYAAEGRLLRSLMAQPMGFLLCIATGVAFWTSLYIAITGAPLGRFLGRLWKPYVLWMIAAIAVLSWLYKVWVHHSGFGW